MSAIANSMTGAPSNTPTQKRTVIERSSGSGRSSALGAVGSRAIPHFGHARGPSDITSGCIGQVKLAPGGASCIAAALGPLRR